MFILSIQDFCVLTGRSLHFRTSVRFAKRAYQFHPHLNSKISTSHLQISHHHPQPTSKPQNHFDTYFDKIPQIQQKSHIPTTQILTKPHIKSLKTTINPTKYRLHSKSSYIIRRNRPKQPVTPHTQTKPRQFKNH